MSKNASGFNYIISMINMLLNDNWQWVQGVTVKTSGTESDLES